MENVGLFDVITISIITVLGFKGLIRGLIKEAFGLVGIIGGVFVASRIANSIGKIIGDIVGIENISTYMIVGFVVSLLVFWSLVYMIGLIVYKIADKSGLGIFDKFLGFCFGTAKVFLIFSISIYALTSIDMVAQKLDKANKDSIMYEVFKTTGSYILKIGGQTPQSIEKIIDKKLEEKVDK